MIYIRMILIIAIILFTISLPGYGRDLGKQHWGEHKIFESLVLIMDYDSNGIKVPWGTGIILKLDTISSSMYLITNRHVFINREKVALNLSVYDIKDSLIISNFKIAENIKWKEYTYFCPSTEDSDFVAIELPPIFDTVGLKPVQSSDVIEFEHLIYGEDVLFYGYPRYNSLGLFETKATFPIVRSGIFAYFANEDIYLKNDSIRFLMSGMFLIDGISMGGNSGGPIYVRRPFPNNNGGISYDRRLAGIISGHVDTYKSIEIKLADLLMVSKKLDSISTREDSLFVSKILNNAYASIPQNPNLAKAISITTIIDYIKRCKLMKSN